MIEDIKPSASMLIPREEMNAILSYVEVALLMSQNNKYTQLKCLLDQATSLMNKIINMRTHPT